MTKQNFDDETLMAFADGELDDAQTLAIEDALATDDALAERLAVFMDSRKLVGDALKPLIDEPVPDALLASVQKMVEDAQKRQTSQQDNVVAFRPIPQTEAAVRTAPRWLAPLAASVVAVMTGVIGYAVGQSGSASNESMSAIAAALDREASGQDVALGTNGSVLHLVSTFHAEGGELCREYELREAASRTLTIACRQDGAWATRLALTTSVSEGYVPASSQDTVESYLTSIHAGAPLSSDEEKQALSR
jgi:anti-sigma factor RsiW